MDESRKRQAAHGDSRDTRAAVETAALEAELEAAMAADLPTEALRARFLETLKAALARSDEAIRRRFEAELSGTRTVHERCGLVDQILRAVYRFAGERLYPLGNLSSGERLALVAVG
ncbi:MAG: hypothetical protein R3285_08775, partial [Kiloniellales bacterium]|nr:hypothetical protein [Kiloniellales bacterium]